MLEPIAKPEGPEVWLNLTLTRVGRMEKLARATYGLYEPGPNKSAAPTGRPAKTVLEETAIFGSLNGTAPRSELAWPSVGGDLDADSICSTGIFVGLNVR